MSRSSALLWFIAISAWCAFPGAAAADEDVQSISEDARSSDRNPSIENALRGSAAAGDDLDDASGRFIQIKELVIGFKGLYKVGHWTPLAVTLRSNSEDAVTGDLAVYVVDGDGTATIVREPNVTVTAGASAVVNTLIKPGRPRAAIHVVFESPAGISERSFADDEIPPALLATQELIVEVGRPIGLARLAQLYPPTSLDRPTAALLEQAEALPQRPLAYEGVNLVALTTSDSDALGGWDATRIEALDRWVQLGGKLIMCVGRNGERIDPEHNPRSERGLAFSVFLPGRFSRVVNRGPAVWESFAGALADPLQSDDGAQPARIPITELGDVRGSVELDDGAIPLVVRTPHGLGEVLFVAADLDRPPFAEWRARTKLVLRLLARDEPSPDDATGREINVQSIRLGYTDLSGQLRAALGQFAGAAMAPFWLVFLMALVYAAAIFPTEYAIVRWLPRRSGVAWALLATLLAASVGAVWCIAREWKGTEPLVNKLDVIDVDPSSGIVRGHTWFGLYSAQTDIFDIGLSVNNPARQSLDGPQISWLGLPGTGLGGMNSQMAAPEHFERGYLFGPNGALRKVPLAAWSSKAFEASWQSQAAVNAAALAERTTDRQPLGVLKNDTGLPLRDCVLFYEGWSYTLGSLEPGDVVDVGKIQHLQTINSYLTGRRGVGEREQAKPYEPEGADLRRIARAMLFHDVAGGRQYTSLTNRVYDRQDWTDQLESGRAVLLAAGPPATALEVKTSRGDEPRMEQEIAFYRFLLLVDRSGRGEGANPTVELRLK